MIFIQIFDRLVSITIFSSLLWYLKRFKCMTIAACMMLAGLTGAFHDMRSMCVCVCARERICRDKSNVFER